MYSVVCNSANFELFSFLASTSDGLQVEAALLIGDFGLFQRLPLSCM
jgi:hypothetical protein